MGRKKKREEEHLRRTLSGKRRRHKSLGQNDKKKPPKSKTVGKGNAPNKHKEKVSTSSCKLDMRRGKNLSICEGKQFSCMVVACPQITKAFDTSPSMNSRLRRQMTSSSSSKEKVICSDLNRDSRNLRTPSKLSGIHKYETPLKSKEKNRHQDSKKKNLTRVSPCTENIEIKSYKERELKKMENCCTTGISPKDTKRCLRSGCELETVKSSGTKIPKEQSLKRKAREEETFVRRKKLRSEVKGDELWEGIFPVRFKRLTPKKPRDTQGENSSHANKISDNKPQGNSLTYPNTKRRSFEDLYVEFLAKSEICLEKQESNDILKNVKGSLSDTCFAVNKGIPKCKMSSKSISGIADCNTGEVAKSLKEVFSKFKEESEIKRNTKLREEDKNLKTTNKDKTETKTDEACDTSNDISTCGDSVVTPKRSLRLQEKISSGKGKLSVSGLFLPWYGKESCSQKKNSAARCLLPEYTNSKSSSNKYPKKPIEELRLEKSPEMNRNQSTHSLGTKRSMEVDINKNTRNSEKAETGLRNRSCRIKEKHLDGNYNLQSGQTPFGLDSRKTPTRDDHKHKSPGRQKRQDVEAKDAVGEITNSKKNNIHIIQEKEILKNVNYQYTLNECQPDINSVKRLEERITMFQNNCEKDRYCCRTDDNRPNKDNSDESITRAKETGDKIKSNTLSQATEYSNNATTNLVKDPVDSKDIVHVHECSEASQRETDERETEEMQTGNGKQTAGCQIAMSSSNIVEKQYVSSSDSKENLDVITDIIKAIVTKTEELQKTFEPKVLRRATDEKGIDISCQMMVAKDPDKITRVHRAIGGYPLFNMAVDNNALSDPESASRDEADLDTSHINNKPKALIESSKRVTDPTYMRKPLKIVMKKTYRGAKIVKKLPELNANPTVDLPRLSAFCSLENPSTSNTLKVNLKIESEKSSQSTPHGVMKHETKNTHIGSYNGRKKQTRSRTRSGEGEMAIALDNPDTELKVPRNKGKVYPQRIKSSGSQDQKKTPKKSHNGLKSSTPTRGPAADLTLLQNQAIGKHAIILWSSDNRRHFQLTHPDLDSAGVEEVMRNAWGDLNTKEKLKYFQRAYSATKDEHRHSTLKKDDTKLSHLNTALGRFLTLNPSKQHEKLQRYLQYVFSISREAYIKLMEDFKTEMNGVNEKTTKTNMHASYRKLLFQRILDLLDAILPMAQQKRDSQRQVIRKEFKEITRKVIVGECVHFSKDVHSERLAELLLDLKDLEINGKVSVSGEFIAGSEYELTLDDLLECEFEIDEWSTQIDLPQAHPQVFAEIFSKALQGKDIPDLGASCMATDLDLIIRLNDELSTENLKYIAGEFDQKVSDTYNNYQNGRIQNCCDHNSPSCYLNNWLVADQFRLLSKSHVVDENALIHPKLMFPVLQPLKQGKKQTGELPLLGQAVKYVNFNSNHGNAYLQAVPKSYIHPHDMVTLSRSANGISSKSESE